jgi:hypothetical protein
LALVGGASPVENRGRSPFAWDRVGEDALNLTVAQTIAKLGRDSEIGLLSDRSSICDDLTVGWLKEHKIDSKDLFVRPVNYQRPDERLKSELDYFHIRDRYKVIDIIDDRPKVCRILLSLGLSVFEVGHPNYEFQAVIAI